MLAVSVASFTASGRSYGIPKDSRAVEGEHCPQAEASQPYFKRRQLMFYGFWDSS